mmetsp:Transcript_11376/g.15640  ORF Transcript_11376/g.15640 Transcript_11376/m.15640 type:complete len:326 (+) Transcript_11376:73-1050(+)
MPEEILSALYSNCTSREEFMNRIMESVECGLFDLHDRSTLKKLFQIVERFNMSFRERTSYCVRLSTTLDNRRDCGLVARVFTSDLTDDEAVNFLSDVVTRDFFYELGGKVKDFLIHIRPSLQSMVEPMLTDAYNIGPDGNIVESDEDSNGNLRGFITSDSDDSQVGRVVVANGRKRSKMVRAESSNSSNGNEGNESEDNASNNDEEDEEDAASDDGENDASDAKNSDDDEEEEDNEEGSASDDDADQNDESEVSIHRAPDEDDNGDDESSGHEADRDESDKVSELDDLQSVAENESSVEESEREVDSPPPRSRKRRKVDVSDDED